ncbi:MAG: methyltransferase domain-containing protein [Candidatus Binatia bacterium]
MSTPIASRLAMEIHDLTRALTAASPAPRGLPYLGLDHASGTRLDVLASLSQRGVFRKYGLVLALGADLGAAARRLAARLGCEAVGTAASAELARAAATLTRRTPQHAHVRSVAAAPAVLPFGTARFTHVWIVESLAQVADAPATIVDVRRVLRPGGFLAVQDLSAVAGAAVADLHVVDPAARAALLGEAGFVEIETRDVTADAIEQAPAVLAARARLLATLRRQATVDPAALAWAETREAVGRALATGALRVTQLVARRP